MVPAGGAAPPTRIGANWSVWPVPCRSTSDAPPRPDLCLQERVEPPLARRPQPCRALLAHLLRHLRHPRRRRAGARRVGEDVQVGQPRLRRREPRSCRNIASSSVGKPGDQVGTEHDVRPQRAQASGQARCTSSRGCRRFIRFSTRSSPACTRQVQMRHQPRLARRPAPPGRGRSRPGRATRAAAAAAPAPAPAARCSIRPRRRRARQVLAVGGDVDPGDDDLAVAVRDQRPRLGDDPRRPARCGWARARRG